MADLIDKAEALRIVMEECYKDREMKLATRIEERIAALTARGERLMEAGKDAVAAWEASYQFAPDQETDRARIFALDRALMVLRAALSATTETSQ